MDRDEWGNRLANYRPPEQSTVNGTKQGVRGSKRRAASYESLTQHGDSLHGTEAPALVDEDSSKFEVVGLAVGPSSWRACLLREPLLLATLIGVVVGIALGLLLKMAHPSQQTIALIGGWRAGWEGGFSFAWGPETIRRKCSETLLLLFWTSFTPHT